MFGSQNEPRNFAAILSFVARETGLTFAENRLASAEAAIRRAMDRVGVSNTDLYLELLGRGGLPMDDLLGELTIGETYFFRDPKQFDFLRQEVVPDLSKKTLSKKTIRAWSAGCATGEEAYTLAILLKEERPGMSDDVVGTDISRGRLAVARRARYRKWSLRSMHPDQVCRYFITRGDTFALQPEYQKRVEFRYLNLAEDSYPAMSSAVWGMDIIMCRNVLIYFDKATVTRVAGRLIGSLSEDGWLLIGPSDPVLSDYIECQVVQTTAGLVYRKPIEGRKQFLSAPVKAIGSPLFEVPGSSAPPKATDSQLPAARPEPSVEPQIQVSSVEGRSISYPGSTNHPDLGNYPDSVNHPDAGEAYSKHPSSAPKVDPLDSAISRRDFNTVVQFAQERFANGDTSEKNCISLVRALANLGRLDEAGRACVSSLELHKSSIELIYLHAILLIQAQMYTEAVVAVKRALYFDRGMVVAHLALATAHAKSGERRKAVKSLENVESLLVQMDPEVVVFASDGETAGHLLAMARVQRRLLGSEV